MPTPAAAKVETKMTKATVLWCNFCDVTIHDGLKICDDIPNWGHPHSPPKIYSKKKKSNKLIHLPKSFFLALWTILHILLFISWKR